MLVIILIRLVILIYDIHQLFHRFLALTIVSIQFNLIL